MLSRLIRPPSHVGVNLGSKMPPTKAIEAGLKATILGSYVVLPLHCPYTTPTLLWGAHLGLGTAQARLRAAQPQLTLKQQLLTFEARSGRAEMFRDHV